MPTRIRCNATSVRFGIALVAATVGMLTAAEPEKSAPRPDPGFVITMWCGPTLAHTTLEDYQRVADCGFNVVQPPTDTCTPDRDGNRKILDLCQQVGIKAYIGALPIVEIGWQHKNSPSDSAVIEAIDAAIQDYADHPALAGYYVADEPWAKDIPDLAQLCRHIDEQDPKHYSYVNLFPYIGERPYYGDLNFEGYLAEYVKQAKPAIFSWDHYTQMQGATGNGGQYYFSNLEDGRRVSLKSKTPFFEFILSTADPGRGYRDPSEIDLRWQVYSGLAYGAHGVGYFTYWTYPGMEMGIMQADGKPGPKFDWVKRINNRIKWIGPTLAKLTSAGVYHSDPLPEGTVKLAADAPVKKMDGGELILGWLKEAGGRDFLFVFNRSFSEKFTAKLTLDAAFKKAEEISQETGKPVAASLSAGVLSCDLEPGEGRLFALVK